MGKWIPLWRDPPNIAVLHSTSPRRELMFVLEVQKKREGDEAPSVLILIFYFSVANEITDAILNINIFYIFVGDSICKVKLKFYSLGILTFFYHREHKRKIKY